MSVNARKGDPIPSYVPHGRGSTYVNWWCRCTPCREAQMVEQRRRRESRIARMRAGSPDVPHGTFPGYNDWCCRCDACSNAAVSYRATRKRAAS